MKSNLLQMKAAPLVERFHRTVETLEAGVNFDINSVANEDGACPLCVVDLPNPGPHGGLCRAILTSENVDQLIRALTAWKALP
jgi:hypothetical protein